MTTVYGLTIKIFAILRKKVIRRHSPSEDTVTSRLSTEVLEIRILPPLRVKNKFPCLSRSRFDVKRKFKCWKTLRGFIIFTYDVCAHFVYKFETFQCYVSGIFYSGTNNKLKPGDK